MRRVLRPALLAAATWPGGLAAAEDAQIAKQRAEQRTETIDGLVRIVGAQAGIVLNCRKLYTMNDTVSQGRSRTVRRALDAAVGRHKAQATIAGRASAGRARSPRWARSDGAPTRATS